MSGGVSGFFYGVHADAAGGAVVERGIVEQIVALLMVCVKVLDILLTVSFFWALMDITHLPPILAW